MNAAFKRIFAALLLASVFSTPVRMSTRRISSPSRTARSLTRPSLPAYYEVARKVKYSRKEAAALTALQNLIDLYKGIE